MKTFTQEEAKSWMIDKSVNLTEKGCFVGYKLIQTETIPKDSGRKNYLARELSNLEYGKKCLLYINEYGIWPSSENIELFKGYRKSIGIDENLTEKPAHLIAYSEKTELYCLLCMVLYFCWGAFFISETANEIIRTSHDEYIELFVRGDILKENAFISKFNAIFKSG